MERQCAIHIANRGVVVFPQSLRSMLLSQRAMPVKVYSPTSR